VAPDLLRRQFVIGAGVVALTLGAFALGRLTARDDRPSLSVADCTDARSGIDVPLGLGAPDGSAYFSRCETAKARNSSFGEPAAAVNIYAHAVGDTVTAWWYPDCGLPDGVVATGTKRPSSCGSTATTGAAP
jgi:hypothetical protein